uniref:Hemoglobin subunit epsilon 1 n=1 Tax=Salarias fasciatus TaxID=181472 RepID=A0A672FLX0_SALFA
KMSLSAKDKDTVKTFWAKVLTEVCVAAPRMCLVVYPWTQRYFGSFGNLYNAAAITSNPKVAAHGRVVLQGLEQAVSNMDNIKAAFADLSVLHSEKLQVDPGNFKLGKDFTAEVQQAFQKFLNVVVASLQKQYY